MKSVSEIYPKSKEELIGTYRKCFFCNKKLEVTEDGIHHWGKKHGINESLENIYEMRLLDIKFQKQLWFGKVTEKE